MFRSIRGVSQDEHGLWLLALTVLLAACSNISAADSPAANQRVKQEVLSYLKSVLPS